MNETAEWDTLARQLEEAGLHEVGRLDSTGIAGHRKRWEQGEVSADSLTQYAADLLVLSEATEAEGTSLPTDFWDARTPAMTAAGMDEYTLVRMLSRVEYGPYIRFLNRCCRHLAEFKQEGRQTAVAAALSLLLESVAYVRGGHPLTMTASRPRLSSEQQAIFLWQQVTTGTNRQIPYLHREAYTHSYWGRFNVVEMWRYVTDSEAGVDETWGLSGFAEEFIRDPGNTNQIEHLAISALAQMVLRLPPFLLNVVESVQWLLRESSFAAAQADKAVNGAIAQHFRPFFSLESPENACANLERALAPPAER